MKRVAICEWGFRNHEYLQIESWTMQAVLQTKKLPSSESAAEQTAFSRFVWANFLKQLAVAAFSRATSSLLQFNQRMAAKIAERDDSELVCPEYEVTLRAAIDDAVEFVKRTDGAASPNHQDWVLDRFHYHFCRTLVEPFLADAQQAAAKKYQSPEMAEVGTSVALCRLAGLDDGLPRTRAKSSSRKPPLLNALIEQKNPAAWWKKTVHYCTSEVIRKYRLRRSEPQPIPVPHNSELQQREEFAIYRALMDLPDVPPKKKGKRRVRTATVVRFLAYNPNPESADDVPENPSGDEVLVVAVVPKSSAAKAGLKPGDVIVNLNRRIISDPAAIRKMIERFEPGQPYPMQIIRNNKKKDLEFTIAAPPAGRGQAKPKNPSPDGPGKSYYEIGLELDVRPRQADPFKKYSIRNRQPVPQQDIARLFGIDQTQISRWLNDAYRQLPSLTRFWAQQDSELRDVHQLAPPAQPVSAEIARRNFWNAVLLGITARLPYTRRPPQGVADPQLHAEARCDVALERWWVKRQKGQATTSKQGGSWVLPVLQQHGLNIELCEREAAEDMQKHLVRMLKTVMPSDNCVHRDIDDWIDFMRQIMPDGSGREYVAKAIREEL